MPAAMIKKKTPNQRRRASAALQDMEESYHAAVAFPRTEKRFGLGRKSPARVNKYLLQSPSVLISFRQFRENQKMMHPELKKSLYRPKFGHPACGVGFVANKETTEDLCK